MKPLVYNNYQTKFKSALQFVFHVEFIKLHFTEKGHLEKNANFYSLNSQVHANCNF